MPGPRGDVGVANEIPGQELNEKRLRDNGENPPISDARQETRRISRYRQYARVILNREKFSPSRAPSPLPLLPIGSRLIRRGNTFSGRIPNNIKTVL